MPAHKKRGKGGRQPASDPRLDPNIDDRRAKRILANRLSAARSKMKQKNQMDVSYSVHVANVIADTPSRNDKPALIVEGWGDYICVYTVQSLSQIHLRHFVSSAGISLPTQLPDQDADVSGGSPEAQL